MNRFDTTEQLLNRLQLSTYEQELLARVEASVMKFMERGTPTVDAIAQELDMHPSKLRRHIKAATGIPASDFFNVVRLRHAMDMLRSYPRYTITDIAQTCGYADAPHFNHAFHRWIGMAPIKYINQH